MRPRITDSGVDYLKAYLDVTVLAYGDGEIMVKVRCENTVVADFSFVESEQNRDAEQRQSQGLEGLVGAAHFS